MNNASAPSLLADRRRLNGLHPVAVPRRPTSRPTVSLADVVELPSVAMEPDAVDAARVQAHHRLYLPSCLAAVGWDQGTEFRVWVDDGRAILSRERDARGKPRKVSSNSRLTLTPDAARSIGAGVGANVAAVVPAGADEIIVLGPLAMAAAVEQAGTPRHVRRLASDLEDASLAATTALARLGTLLTEAQLVALSSWSVERLDELGLFGPSAAGEWEVR